MTKINLSLGMKLTALGIFTFLIFSGKTMPQDSSLVQKAFQSCLDHRKVQPHLKAVSFDHYNEVLAVWQNEYATSKMKLNQFGKAAVISHKTDLFFHAIEDYVRLSDVRTEDGQIVLTFTAGVEFTCTYLSGKNKVTKLTFE